jgi:hypothetical protein
MQPATDRKDSSTIQKAVIRERPELRWGERRFWPISGQGFSQTRSAGFCVAVNRVLKIVDVSHREPNSPSEEAKLPQKMQILLKYCAN